MVRATKLRTAGAGSLERRQSASPVSLYIYLALPDVRTLRTANPTTTAFMELRAGEARAKGQKPKHVQRWVSYSAHLAEPHRAVLVAEDAAFWEHDGLDSNS